MAVDIKISGVTVSALDDYSISESVGNISSSSITVHVTSGVPQPMQKVEFYIGGVKYFTGLIEDVSSPTWNSKHTIADYVLSITSIETILNNRRVTGSWKSKLAHEIVSDLITDYLLDEGLTAGSISVTDKSYDNYNCEGTRLSEVLDELARDTGASYYINSALAFNFVAPADYPTVTVPADINEISENIESNDLVTVQTVIGAQKETEEQAESILSWTGTYWDLQFQVTTITGMTINGEIAQHGIKDIDTDPSITFWYEVGSRRITLNPAATFIPDEGDLVACLYKGYLNITATETNDTLIAQLQALNGTSGRIEAVHNDESILTFTDAYNKAVELLAKSGEVTKTVTLKTHSLTASALNNKWVLSLADAKISGTYYVTARTITRFANEFECTVTLKNKSADLRPGSSLYKSTKSTNTAVNTSTIKPDTVADCVAIARENYIELSCNKVAQELNNTLKWYRWEIKKSIAGEWSGASVVLTDTNSGQYVFDRGIDGYPEASDLAGWSVRVMAVDIYGNDADNYSNVTGIITTTYGTWIPTAPALSPYASKRDFTVSITQGSSARQIYGDIVYRAEIKRYDEVDYYKPNLTADPYESEDNYKDGAGYVTVTSYIQQRVPLENQATAPQSTSYTYRFTTVNATTGVVGASATVTLIASASTAQDIVNKSMDAEKLNVQDLAAVSTVFGSIRSDGIAKDSTNFWNLSDPSSALGYGQEGEMCVGTSASVEVFDPVTNPSGYKDTDSFFHFIPQNTGTVFKGLYLKLANFIITAVKSVVTGMFEVVQRQTEKTIFKVDDVSEYTSGIQTETSTTLVDDDALLTNTIIDKLTRKSVVINSTAYHLVPDEPILLIQNLSTGIETQVVTPILFKGIHNVGGVLHAIGAGGTYSYVSNTWTQIPIDWISALVVQDKALSNRNRYCCAVKDNFLYIPISGGTVLEVVDLTTFTVQNKTLPSGNRERRCCAIKDNFLYIPIQAGTVLEVVDLTTFIVQDKTLSASNRSRRCCAIKDNFLYIPINNGTVLEVVDLTTFIVQDKTLSAHNSRYCCAIKDNFLYIPTYAGTVLEVVDLTTFTVQNKALSNRTRYCCAIKDNFLYIPINTVLEVVDLTTFTVQDKALSSQLRYCCVIKDNFLYIPISNGTVLEVVDLTTFTVQNKTLSANNRDRYCCAVKDNFLYIPTYYNTALEVVAGLPYLQHKTTTNNTTHILSTSTGVIETIKASNGEYTSLPAPNISGSPLSITIGAVSFFPDFTTGKITKYNAGTITTVNTTVRANIKTLITDGTNMFISGLGNVIYKVAQDGTQTALTLSQLSNSMYHTLGIIGTKMYVIPETSSPRFAEVNLSTFALIQYALFSPSWGALRGEGVVYNSKYWLAEKNTKKQHRLAGIKEALSDIKTLKPIGSGFIERTINIDGTTMLETADGERVIFGADKNLIAQTATIAGRSKDSYPIPTDAVLQYSFDEIKQLPDNPAGTVYIRDNDWTTVDGWSSGGTVSVNNNNIISTSDGTTSYIARDGSYGSGNFISITYIPPNTTTIGLYGNINGVKNTLIKQIPVIKNKSTKIVAYVADTMTSFHIYNPSLVVGDVMRITQAYVGDGSYLEPVIDNSYSEAHAENHGVIPVDGVCGKAGYFNNSYIIAPRPALGDDITIYFWVKFDALGSNTILQSRTAYNTGLNVIQLNDVYRLDWRGDIITFTGYTPPVNTWHHVCMKMNATTKVLKINGETKVTLTGTYGTTANLASTIWSGMRGLGGTPSEFPLTGALDGLKVVPRFTTDDEDIGEYKARANLPKFYATADKWKTARNVTISDADGTNTGTAVSVDGSENETLKLPSTIKANITGNADTATKLATARKINGVDFDGTADVYDTYSTTEHRIGTWIDGKPLYRKVIDFGALPNATTKNVAHGISNLDEMIRLYGMAVASNSYQPLPYASTVTSYSILLDMTNSVVSITSGVNKSAYSARITIEYTKTTD